MKVTVTPIKGIDLKAGDLFTTADQEYWNRVNANEHHSIGEKLYMRTSEPCPEDQFDEDVYKAVIQID